MEKLTLLLLVILSWLQYSLWLGKNGIHSLSSIKKDFIFQKQRNSSLKIRNEQLCAKINDLHNKLEDIEKN
ncbi:septum formation initiator family protein [Candidatus Erwinia haradaeae]|uniref:Cell division protein FtsB, partial n=1 Tax=Candidatus Erwinia haradaeae TaxID=1922217 RepID=A0A451D3J6_9GAMM|nr:septum formation initiator family protein [Candidatus Erwinia haradaeae]VFP80240.1 Cell division protein FtsB [Candidatus Erwinia haradaeae]